MIGVIRTDKNPTMRHLERTHGISIGWMHSIFQEGYVSLAYEVTAKMAADIHTKSFKDSVSWTHACQLINIFPPALIGSQEIMDLMRPTHAQSADEKGHQHYSYKGEVPCFPYTETPILPQVLYRAGLSSKEGLQEHDSVDPIVPCLPNGGRWCLIIQFYDYDGGLVHTYKDPSSGFKLRVTIKDAPKKTTVWTVIGVDEDNWWNDCAPGMDCMKEFAPGPHYDPSAQVNVLCTGNQVDDAMCSYLYDVMTSRQQNANAVIFVGAGVLGGSSWLNRQINENFGIWYEDLECACEHQR